MSVSNTACNIVRTGSGLRFSGCGVTVAAAAALAPAPAASSGCGVLAAAGATRSVAWHCAFAAAPPCCAIDAMNFWLILFMHVGHVGSFFPSYHLLKQCTCATLLHAHRSRRTSAAASCALTTLRHIQHSRDPERVDDDTCVCCGPPSPCGGGGARASPPADIKPNAHANNQGTGMEGRVTRGTTDLPPW